MNTKDTGPYLMKIEVYYFFFSLYFLAPTEEITIKLTTLAWSSFA